MSNIPELLNQLINLDITNYDTLSMLSKCLEALITQNSNNKELLLYLEVYIDEKLRKLIFESLSSQSSVKRRRIK